jgi:hypothetical protein
MERNLVKMGRVELGGNRKNGGPDFQGEDRRKGDVNVPRQMGRMES